MSVTRELREFVRTRENRCCGYCGVTENSVGAALTIDHFRPSIHGGDDAPENLVYCCHACNSFKDDYWSDDPSQRLLCPRFDGISEHLALTDNGTIRALSVRGELQVRTLHLNREALVEHRREIVQIAAMRERQRLLILRVNEAERGFEELRRRIRELLP